MACCHLLPQLPYDQHSTATQSRSLMIEHPNTYRELYLSQGRKMLFTLLKNPRRILLTRVTE